MLKLKAKVRVVADRADEVSKAVRGLTKLQVLVGVPAEKAPRQEGTPINNAALAYIHNYGSPVANIPARPFMEPGIKDANAKIAEGMKLAAQASLEGKKEETTKGLVRVGLVAQNSIKRRITTGPFAPLKPGTIAARRRRGRTGTKPLLDTGAMRNSITFVIRAK